LLTLILAEAELEIVPEEIRSHPAVTAVAKRKGKKPEYTLLDSSYHHTAMHELEEGFRRGRPDIVHIFLLTSLESILNKKGLLRVIVHTRNNEVIYIDPSTRIMKNYDRFVGLIEQLFDKKAVPINADKPLLKLESNTSLEKIVDQAKSDFVIGFSEKGKQVKLLEYINNLKRQNIKNITCIIGGFPKGDFYSNIEKIADDVISIYPDMLVAWTIAAEMIVNYENVYW
jgi:rRNA small subunit pseudouridine methyltransferase Nep1